MQNTSEKNASEDLSEKDVAHQPETIAEKVEASVKGEDEPIEREHPLATGALVWFTYPIVLIVVLLIVFIAVTYFR